MHFWRLVSNRVWLRQRRPQHRDADGRCKAVCNKRFILPRPETVSSRPTSADAVVHRLLGICALPTSGPPCRKFLWLTIIQITKRHLIALQQTSIDSSFMRYPVNQKSIQCCERE